MSKRDYICRECLEELLVETKPRKCPNCGEHNSLIRNVDDQRERDEDDGSTYADPRDEIAERRERAERREF